jgi:hypothetical protein
VIRRRNSLQQALGDLEAGVLENVAAIVVNRGWWEALAGDVQDSYYKRCAQRGVELRADSRLSPHFVEVIGESEPPLSTERRV